METRATQKAKEKTITPSMLATPGQHGLEQPPRVPAPELKAVGYGLPGRPKP